MGKGQFEEDERQREARQILDRVGRESDPQNAINRFSGRVQDHFSAADAPRGDPIELWGRRIGRILALIALAVAVLWLFSQIMGAPA